MTEQELFLCKVWIIGSAISFAIFICICYYRKVVADKEFDNEDFFVFSFFCCAWWVVIPVFSIASASYHFSIFTKWLLIDLPSKILIKYKKEKKC